MFANKASHERTHERYAEVIQPGSGKLESMSLDTLGHIVELANPSGTTTTKGPTLRRSLSIRHKLPMAISARVISRSVIAIAKRR